MSDDALQTNVGTVTRALTAAGYITEPDPENNSSNAPAYLKIYCRDIPKNKRVDYLNLVFRGPDGESVIIEGEDKVYVLPAQVKTLVERVRYNLPCE